MEVTAITALLGTFKGWSEAITLVLVAVALIISFVTKRKDIDLTQVTSFSKLQTEQLSQLIDQNSKLAEELRAVRKELSEAYKIIDEMRLRMTELEEMLRSKGSE